MNAATTLISLARKLDSLEMTVQNIQVAQKMLGEMVQNEIEKVQLTTAKACKDLASSSDNKLAFTPTTDEGDAASASTETEKRLQICEKMQEQLSTSLTAVRSEFIPISALKAIEERLEKLEEFRDLATPREALEEGGKFVKPQEQTPGEVMVFSSNRHRISGSSDMNRSLLASRQYELQGSVYDASLLIGFECLTAFSSIMIGICFGINMVMQLGVVTILSSDSFIQKPFSATAMDRYRVWRTSSHAYSKADAITGTSLAARMCNFDEALSVASTQMIDLNDVSNYLEGGKGLLLRNIATVLWFFCCALELRRTVSFVLAVACVPINRGDLSHGRVNSWIKGRSEIHADTDGVNLMSLSFPRLVFALGLAACRITVAALLLYFGCVWLFFTKSIMDLLLNSSALSFVLDIDETIYGVFSPLVVQGLISSMRPLRLPHNRRLLLIPITIFLFCSLITVTLNFHYSHLTEDMRTMKAILCSDNKKLDFILGTNALGWITFAESPPYSISSNMTSIMTQPTLQASLDVAELIIAGDPAADHYILNVSTEDKQKNRQALRETALATLATLTEYTPCVDLHWNPGAKSDAKLGGFLWSATGQASLRDVTMCSEVKHLCYGLPKTRLAQNVRFMCPITCGCEQPASGLWDLFQAEAGCPETNCRDKFWQEKVSAVHQCNDTALQDLQTWIKWDRMVHRMYEYGSINMSVLENLTNQGCEALQFLNSSEKTLLCHGKSQLQGKTFHGAGFICPVSCGCTDADYAREASVNHYDFLCPYPSCLDKIRNAWIR